MQQKKTVVSSREVVPVRFPLFSEKGLERFLAMSEERMPEYGISESKINQPYCALNVGWVTTEDTGPDMSGVVDDILGSTMNIVVNREHDDKYGKSHYYLYKRNGRTFVLMGDNCYGPEYGRLLLNWQEELPKDDPSAYYNWLL